MLPFGEQDETIVAMDIVATQDKILCVNVAEISGKEIRILQTVKYPRKAEIAALKLFFTPNIIT